MLPKFPIGRRRFARLKTSIDSNYEPEEVVVSNSDSKNVKKNVSTPVVISSKKVVATPIKKAAKSKKPVHTIGEKKNITEVCLIIFWFFKIF